MTEETMSREQVREMTSLWWLPLSIGILSVIAGVIVLAKPGDSLTTLAVITGIFVLVGGIAELFASLRNSTENRGMVALLGVLNVIVGVLLIRHPVGGVTFVAMVLGVWLIAAGTIHFVQAFEFAGHRVWRFCVAAIQIVAGIAILANPDIGYATLALLTGLAFIIYGAGMSMLGMAMHAVKKDTETHGGTAVAVGM